MRHHYVPQFLLGQWSSEGWIVAYYWENGAGRVIENSKASVASACQIPNLNTYFGVPADFRDFPETGFFTPKIDTPAAPVHARLTRGEVGSLTPKEKTDWARFLVSLGVRTTETLREMGPLEARKALGFAATLATGPENDERLASKIIEQNMPKLERKFPLNIAMDLTFDPTKLNPIIQMDWWLRRWSKECILIGDRPLLAFPIMKYPCGIPLDNPSCLFAIAISPRAVFFGAYNRNTRSKMRKMTPSRIAHILNEETIRSCGTTVFAANRSMAEFITHRVTQKTNGAWLPTRDDLFPR
jgi:hypothetical protein